MKRPEEIILDLELLNSKEKLSIDEIDKLEIQIRYEGIGHYLESLKHGTKPETASAELMRALVKDVLQKTSFSEVKIELGFIDFAIQENKVNPLLLELKPAFDRIYDKGKKIKGIEAVKLELPNHKNQVIKYLKGNDFIILTNLNDCYLFNRDALIEYKPFLQIKFTELLRTFLDSENLWDTVRRLEDLHVKPELENEFFADLTKWFDELSLIKFIEQNGTTKSELVVLLINKIIFIKTLEDYGLIPYKFLEDEYFSKYNKWEIKGIQKILDNFFTEIEEWFWDYYDTELFRVKIWDYIDKSKSNLERFQRIFEKVLGVGQWEYTFGKGMIHYNYRKIDEDVFGKAYETFIAKTRKDSGIYYTHRLITQYMSEQLVKRLFEPVVNNILKAIDKNDYLTAKNLLPELYKITIADTTSGSGSFLIKCFREIYKCYQLVAKKLEWVTNLGDGHFEKPRHVINAEEFIQFASLNQKNKRKLIASVILRHIHAIDIDDRALETAKTNMWKEAIKLEKGLFNFRRLGSDYNHILPSLQLNFINADALYDLPTELQIEIITDNFKDEIKSLHKIRSAYIINPTEPDLLLQVPPIKKLIREKLSQAFEEKLRATPTFICLEFFYLFFDEAGEPLLKDNRGFTGIISNPPWEEIYPVKKEFADIGKYEMDRNNFQIEFEKKIKKDKNFKKQWEEYLSFYDSYTLFVSENYSYHKLKPATSTAMRSHLNLFKLLFERDMQLLSKGGFLNILIPSSFQTDEGSFGLRKLALQENKLIELYSFENRGFTEIGKTGKTKIFPDVHPQFKFSIVFIQKQLPGKNDSFNSLFYLTNPGELQTRIPLPYSLEMVRNFSPDNLSIMEFAHKNDYELCVKIKGAQDILGQHGLVFRREFNVTDDSGHFIKEKGKTNAAPLFEGKTIHQFNSRYSLFNYYIKPETAHEDLFNKEAKRIKTDLKLTIKTEAVKKLFEKKSYKLDYQSYRLVYRSIGRSTDERTLIATIIPPETFAVNSVNYLINYSYSEIGKTDFKQLFLEQQTVVFVMALMNSLVLNYFIRNKISANLNMFYLYELPIPNADSQTKQLIIEKAFILLYHKSNSVLYEDFRNELKIDREKLDSYKEESTHNKLRAELEILIAKELYNLSKEDWLYLTSTFTYGENEVTRKELDEIIKISNTEY